MLNLVSRAKVFCGMMLAQPMDEVIDMLECAFAASALTVPQGAQGLRFFLTKAHYNLREDEADRCFRCICRF